MTGPRRSVECGLIVACALLLSSPGVVDAQFVRQPRQPLPPPSIGARGGFDWDEDVWSIGGFLRFSLPMLPGIQIQPSGDVFLLDGRREWQVNADALIRLAAFAYGGAGFVVAYDSLPTSSGPTTETGYNLFIGVDIPRFMLPIKPFAEARWTYINRRVSPFRTVAGISIPLGVRGSRRR